jgi:hypothetical protein
MIAGLKRSQMATRVAINPKTYLGLPKKALHVFMTSLLFLAFVFKEPLGILP